LWGYRENDAMGGDDPYSASKGCSELITHSYITSFFNKDNTAHVASGRAGNVIGGGDWADNRVIPDMMRAYEAKQNVSVRNPSSVRPWQFVLEPVYGYMRLAEKLMREGKQFEGGWNFGPSSFESYTVGDVVKEVQKLLPAIKIETPELTEKKHEAGLLKLDVTKAVNLLNWKPKLNFEQTIQFTVDGYKDEMEQTKDLYTCRVKQITNYCNT
jgi:CDP-glucose 4,6-dehydratase